MTKPKADETFFKRLLRNLHHKYKLLIINESTLEERISLRLSQMNVIFVLLVFSIISISITTLIIYLSPLKEYIPGYASVYQVKQVYINRFKVDSLTQALEEQNLYLENFEQRILLGKNLNDSNSTTKNTRPDMDYSNISDRKSDEDSMLRKEWENQSSYDLIYYPGQQSASGISQFVFFPPIKGLLINGFDNKKRHFGVDILGTKDASIFATLDGTVIFSSWTSEAGYVITIQHADNLISIYKHNSSLLKVQGNRVKAGEPVAIIGNTGEHTTGIHLHFELWYEGNPVNPVDFIQFD
jgi:murein DD-endopeptidase MepM/ murein hydrolase activator NlpD